MTLENQRWMMPMVDFFHGCSLHLKDYRKPPAMQVISYRKNDSASMIKAIPHRACAEDALSDFSSDCIEIP